MTLALPTSVKEAVALKNERRIFGPPGTGKTTYLERLVKGYVEEKKYRPSEIVVTSFTRGAAAEVASRGTGIPQENIQTLHALGFRLLGGGELAESHIDEWNAWVNQLTHSRLFLLSNQNGQSEDETGGKSQKTNATRGDDHFAQYTMHRAKLTIKEELARGDGPFAKFVQYWEDWKRETGYLDFQDMIDLPFERKIAMPSSAKVLICDEFQDFTAAEARLARFWGKEMQEFILAGDDDQCLYFFKGASSDNFIYPELPPEQMHILSQSYRVPRQIQQYAERWIKFVEPNRQIKEYQPRREQFPDGTFGEIIEGKLIYISNARVGNGFASHASRSWQDSKWCLQDAMSNYIAQGKSVMFLTSCAYMLNPLKELMREEGIPFHNPYRRKRTDWNPLQPSANGVSSIDRLLAFLRPSTSVWGNEARMWTIDDFMLWTEALQKKDVLRYHGKTPAAIKRYRDELADVDPGALEQSLDLIEHLSEWLTDEALQNALDQNLDWFEDKLVAAKRDALEYPLHIAKSHGGKALLAEPKVILGTIHSVKGGAADVVYLFPDISDNAEVETKSREGRDALVRLFYVGMTRARETLVLCPAANKYFAKFPRP